MRLVTGVDFVLVWGAVNLCNEFWHCTWSCLSPGSCHLLTKLRGKRIRKEEGGSLSLPQLWRAFLYLRESSLLQGKAGIPSLAGMPWGCKGQWVNHLNMGNADLTHPLVESCIVQKSSRLDFIAPVDRMEDSWNILQRLIKQKWMCLWLGCKRRFIKNESLSPKRFKNEN
jgi:hypothetical protein